MWLRFNPALEIKLMRRNHKIKALLCFLLHAFLQSTDKKKLKERNHCLIEAIYSLQTYKNEKNIKVARYIKISSLYKTSKTT